MAEAQLSTAHSFATQDYSESFFASVPSDGRFLACPYHKFPPETDINQKTIGFSFARFQGSNVYLIQDTAIELKCKITKKNKTLPDKDKFVAPNCNVLHTAFEAVRVYVNEKCITPR